MNVLDWYARNFPDSTLNDEQRRCLPVLTAWKALYNINPTGSRTRTDGGFRPCGHGIEIHLRGGESFSTYDFDELTRLTIAAHRHRCRVSISAGGWNALVVQVHPRSEDNSSGWSYHPGLDDLIARCVG